MLFATARVTRGSFHPDTGFYVDHATGERVEVAVAREDFEVSAGQFAPDDEIRPKGSVGDLLFNDPAAGGRLAHLSPEGFARRFSPAPTRPPLLSRVDASGARQDGTWGRARPRLRGMERKRAMVAWDQDVADRDRRTHVRALADERDLAPEDVEHLVAPAVDPSRTSFYALRVREPIELPASEVIGATGSTAVAMPGDWVAQQPDGRLRIVAAADAAHWHDAPLEFPERMQPRVAHPSMRLYHELSVPSRIDPGSLFLGADADAVARGRAAVARPEREVVATRLDEPFEVGDAAGRPGDYLVQDPSTARLSIVPAEEFPTRFEQRPHPRAARRAVVEIDGHRMEIERGHHPEPGYCSITSAVEGDLMDAQRRAGAPQWRLASRLVETRIPESEAAKRFPALFPDGIGPDTSD